MIRMLTSNLQCHQFMSHLRNQPRRHSSMRHQTKMRLIRMKWSRTAPATENCMRRQRQNTNLKRMMIPLHLNRSLRVMRSWTSEVSIRGKQQRTHMWSHQCLSISRHLRTTWRTMVRRLREPPHRATTLSITQTHSEITLSRINTSNAGLTSRQSIHKV